MQVGLDTEESNETWLLWYLWAFSNGASWPTFYNLYHLKWFCCRSIHVASAIGGDWQNKLRCGDSLCSFVQKAMWKSWRNIVTVVGALALMVACGLAAYVGALTFLIQLGSKIHGNYEYYGRYPSSGVFIFASGAIGFVIPGVILWHLRNHNFRFSLRTLFIVLTVVAIITAIYAVSL